MQGMQDEAANKGAALKAYYDTLDNMGMKTSAAYASYKKGQIDKNTMNSISNAFQNYGFDINNPQHWELMKKFMVTNKIGQ